MTIEPSNASFFLISFEGPDPYSQAGGLGVRIGQLAAALAERGFDTHLLFVGDPNAPGEEDVADRLTYHRWCQWISRYHPAGVYDGEEGKLLDFEASVPTYVLQFVKSTLAHGRLPVILAEEWHTAGVLIRLGEALDSFGLQGKPVVLWNANNTMSFHRVDWGRLQRVAQITTVSRYMKHLMWRMGLNPIVIPNGIPARLLEAVDSRRVRSLRKALDPNGDAVMLAKFGRFDPAKRWLIAIDAAARIKASGSDLVFAMGGGIEPHGAEVLERARQQGLDVVDVTGRPASFRDLLRLLKGFRRADVYNLRFFMTQEMIRPFYRAADAVLANSGHEPFGLVGLEAMAAGGLVFTGATGEEYAFSGIGAVTLDTDSPEEILTHIREVRTDPARMGRIRKEARRQAAKFTWDKVIDILLEKLTFIAYRQGLIPDGKEIALVRRPRDVVVYTVVHQPRRIRLPARSIRPGTSPDALATLLFDDAVNEKYFRKVASTCYYPAVERFSGLVARGLKLSIGFSWSFVEQARRWDPRLLERFIRLVRHENVELVAVEPTHSFALLWDIRLFMERMRLAADRLESIFGVRPTTADTTEMMMSDTIYHALDAAGFRGAVMDGRPWVMEWREPTYLYHHDGGGMKLLTRHYPLSDDVGYRFSDRSWPGWPLTADRYAWWLASNPGDVVVIGWDFETFGEHHRAETGIFDFLDALPMEVESAGLRFATPSEIIERHGGKSFDLPLPEFASTWAGSGGLEFFLGNDAQRAIYGLMVQAHQKALLTGDPELVELALWLAQSDNLHLIQWFGRSGPEAEVSAYFTPQEWWSLTPGGIIWEMQQVYKNFIRSLDAHLPQRRQTSAALYPGTRRRRPGERAVVEEE